MGVYDAGADGELACGPPDAMIHQQVEEKRQLEGKKKNHKMGEVLHFYQYPRDVELAAFVPALAHLMRFYTPVRMHPLSIEDQSMW